MVLKIVNLLYPVHYVYVYIYMYIYMCMFIYIYVYIYIYTYTYILYIYICILCIYKYIYMHYVCPTLLNLTNNDLKCQLLITDQRNGPDATSCS